MKSLLERYSHKLEDNVKIDLSEIVCEDVNWIHLAKDSDHRQPSVSPIMNLQVP
jgi:hypothetical protein